MYIYIYIYTHISHPLKKYTCAHVYNIGTFILWQFRVKSSNYVKRSFERTGTLIYRIDSLVLTNIISVV